jgi:RHS repeat-associated protein
VRCDPRTCSSIWTGSKTLDGSGTSTTAFGFQGAYTDSDGLIYLINRYYDPATQQFLSVDPKVAATGEPYVFTGNDPLNGADPLGTMVNQGNGHIGGVSASSAAAEYDLEVVDSPASRQVAEGIEQYTNTEAAVVHANPSVLSSAAETASLNTGESIQQQILTSAGYEDIGLLLGESPPGFQPEGPVSWSDVGSLAADAWCLNPDGGWESCAWVQAAAYAGRVVSLPMSGESVSCQLQSDGVDLVISGGGVVLVGLPLSIAADSADASQGVKQLAYGAGAVGTPIQMD